MKKRKKQSKKGSSAINIESSDKGVSSSSKITSSDEAITAAERNRLVHRVEYPPRTHDVVRTTERLVELNKRVREQLEKYANSENKRIREKLEKYVNSAMEENKRTREELEKYVNSAVKKALYSMQLRMDDLESNHRMLARELYENMIPISLGLDLSAVPMRQFLPVRIYLSHLEGDQESKVLSSFKKLANSLDFTVVDSTPAQRGSWFKRLIWKSNDLLTTPEVQERLKKVERAIELQGLQKNQAVIDRTQSDAVAGLITSLKDTPQAALQIGSILLVKVRGSDGSSQLMARTLTQVELIKLEKNPDLLKDPINILAELAGKKPRNLKSKVPQLPADESFRGLTVSLKD